MCPASKQVCSVCVLGGGGDVSYQQTGVLCVCVMGAMCPTSK